MNDIAKQVYANCCTQALIESGDQGVPKQEMICYAAYALEVENIFYEVEGLPNEERKTYATKAAAQLAAAIYSSTENSGLPAGHGTRPNHF
jgi:hypothetical protein